MQIELTKTGTGIATQEIPQWTAALERVDDVGAEWCAHGQATCALAVISMGVTFISI